MSLDKPIINLTIDGDIVGNNVPRAGGYRLYKVTKSSVTKLIPPNLSNNFETPNIIYATNNNPNTVVISYLIPIIYIDSIDVTSQVTDIKLGTNRFTITIPTNLFIPDIQHSVQIKYQYETPEFSESDLSSPLYVTISKSETPNLTAKGLFLHWNDVEDATYSVYQKKNNAYIKIAEELNSTEYNPFTVISKNVGTYTFAVTSLQTGKFESEKSNDASITISKRKTPTISIYNNNPLSIQVYNVWTTGSSKSDISLLINNAKVADSDYTIRQVANPRAFYLESIAEKYFTQDVNTIKIRYKGNGSTILDSDYSNTLSYEIPNYKSLTVDENCYIEADMVVTIYGGASDINITSENLPSYKGDSFLDADGINIDKYPMPQTSSIRITYEKNGEEIVETGIVGATMFNLILLDGEYVLKRCDTV